MDKKTAKTAKGATPNSKAQASVKPARHSVKKVEPKTIELKASKVSKPRASSVPKSSPPPKPAESAKATASETASVKVPANAKQAEKVLPEGVTNATASKSAASVSAPSQSTAAKGGDGKPVASPFGRGGAQSAKPKGTPDAASSAKSSATGASAKPAKSSGSGLGKVAAGIIGGVIALGGGVALQYANILPSPGSSIGADISALQSQVDARVARLEAQIAEVKGSTSTVEPAALSASIEEKLTGVVSETVRSEVANQLDAQMSTRLEAVQSGTSETVAQLTAQATGLNEKLTRLETAMSKGAGGETAALSALTARMDQFETKIESATATPSVANDLTPDAKAALVASVKLDLAGDMSALKTANDERINGITETVSNLSTLVAGLETSVEQIGSRTKSLPEKVADEAAVTQQVEALSGQLKDQASEISGLRDKVENGADKKAAVALSAAALKTSIDRGLPFDDTLTTMLAVGGSAQELAPLQPYAQIGIPTLAMLSEQFGPLSDKILIAVQPKEEPGTLARLLSGAKSLVKVRPIGAVEGEGPDAIVSRITAALRKGDLAETSVQWQSLPEPGKAVSTDWHDAVLARLTADQLMAKTVKDAMLGPQKP